MDQEILQTLQETNEILTRLTVLLVAAILFWIIRSAFGIFVTHNRFTDDNWIKVAKKMLYQANYQALYEMSVKKVSKEPNCYYAIYYKLKAKEYLGRTNGMKELIERLETAAPSWKEDWMDKYLEENLGEDSQPVAGGDATR